MLGSTRIVDRGYTFRTDSFRHEKVPNFDRSAVTLRALVWCGRAKCFHFRMAHCAQLQWHSCSNYAACKLSFVRLLVCCSFIYILLLQFVLPSWWHKRTRWPKT